MTCNRLKPIVHGLEQEYWGKVDFVYLDRENEANKDVVDRFNVRGQPVFFLLKPNGETIQSWFGAPSPDELRTAMNDYLAEAGG